MNGPEERDQRSEIRDRREGPGPRVQGPEGENATEFERALARAMRRVEVRAETAAKFYAVAEEAEQKRVHAGGGFRPIKLSNGGRVFAMPRIPQARAWMGGAIAAVLAVGCFVGAHMHTEHERRVQAERQFEASQRITDQVLERTREQLQAEGIYLDR